jgi:hypothetical protein
MPVLRAVSDLCDQVVRDADLAPLRATAEEGLTKLKAPLVIAVCGQLSAGKSTLVNALVGRRVAATGAGETTEVNWWFRRGTPERARAKCADGSVRSFPIDQVVLETESLDADALDPITVLLDHELLDDVVVVDSPGFFSPTEERSARAVELLARRTARATAAADALLYLTDEVPGAQRDVRTIDSFQDPLAALRKAPTNVLLLLSRADELWSPHDTHSPLELGDALLASHRAELSSRVWDAVPVIGLLAESARLAHALDAQAVSDLRALARDPARRLRLLSRAALLEGELEGVPVARRERLLERLGTYGLARAVALVGDGSGTLEELRRDLLDCSGFAAVATLIRTTFRDRSELIRTDAVLAALEGRALRYAPEIPDAALRRLRSGVEAIRLSAAGTELERLRALRLSLDIEVELPTGARPELRRVLGAGPPRQRLGAADGAEPATLETLARERERHWKTIANGVPSSPQRRFVAAQAALAYARLSRELRRVETNMKVAG